MMKQPLIILTGPTASGKTALSVELAARIGGEIISADSMQVYRHMDVGSAKVTKEEIVHAAVDIVRKNGAQALNARTVAGALGCSTQPVFSNFESMEQLFFAAVQQADALYQGYIAREVEQGAYPPYKASGMAYIRFAKEEKELFKLLFMRDRTEEQSSAQWELGVICCCSG